MSDTPLTAREEWKLHWGLVLASTIGFGFLAIITASNGLFLEPLSKEFGWSRTMASSGISIASVISALLAPFFGILIDKWGTRKFAIPGIIATTASMVSFAFVNGSVVQWYVLWIIYSIVCLSVKSTIWTTAVAGVFEASRGLALGFVVSGTAIALIIVPPIGNLLIEDYGWRVAYAGLAIGWGVVALILCLIFHRDVHDVHRAKVAASATGHVEAPILTGLSVKQAWRSSALWRIAISTFIIMMVTLALTVHQFPLLTHAGVSRTDAAWLASLVGVSGIAGKLVTGWLMDRWKPNLIGGITLGSGAFAFLLLLEPFRTIPVIVIAMLINGYAFGTKLQITSYLTTRYGGMKNFGKIFGVMGGLIAAGSGLGPVIGGIIYDTYGNYTPLLIIGTIGCLISGLLIAGLPGYPEWEETETPVEAEVDAERGALPEPARP